jgi:hypothetical protein
VRAISAAAPEEAFHIHYRHNCAAVTGQIPRLAVPAAQPADGHHFTRPSNYLIEVLFAASRKPARMLTVKTAKHASPREEPSLSLNSRGNWAITRCIKRQMSMTSDLERLHADALPLRGQQHGDTPGLSTAASLAQYEAAKSTRFRSRRE